MPVPKFTQGFVFRDFHPDRVLIANGERATLRWAGDASAAYTMSWNREQVSVAAAGEQEWQSPPLRDTTVFRLEAALADGAVSTTLTTQVGVIRPHLSVDDLVARGSVHLLGTSEDLPLPEPTAHNQPARSRPYHAMTDGILFGHLRAKAGRRPAQLSAHVTHQGRDEDTSIFTSDNSDTNRTPVETPFQLPVRHGASASLAFTGTTEDLLSLTWIPMGGGRLSS
ncbi:hypothetical protein M1P56_17085 [Streptomyces sp. HU2014]|uniref:hypothetical protein n=1 Tax=Streptomyces sp. HU2014 TaxID=2939414 RepID=UPI00200E0DE6|nr:hypothetical protein [Streptomyces sp. HU2014]UQI45947.1 hypothetical protein M1P56_17085 [Streptomyces sp. HU2014]